LHNELHDLHWSSSNVAIVPRWTLLETLQEDRRLAHATWKGGCFDSSVVTEYYVCVSLLLSTDLFINFLLSAVMPHLNFAARVVDLAAHPLITIVLRVKFLYLKGGPYGLPVTESFSWEV
jgi:hypothetical protein